MAVQYSVDSTVALQVFRSEHQNGVHQGVILSPRLFFRIKLVAACPSFSFKLVCGGCYSLISISHWDPFKRLNRFVLKFNMTTLRPLQYLFWVRKWNSHRGWAPPITSVNVQQLQKWITLPWYRICWNILKLNLSENIFVTLWLLWYDVFREQHFLFWLKSERTYFLLSKIYLLSETGCCLIILYPRLTFVTSRFLNLYKHLRRTALHIWESKWSHSVTFEDHSEK